MDVDMIGWGHTRFGRSPLTLEALIVETTRAALAHAETPTDEMDEIVLGHSNAGFSAQDFTAARQDPENRVAADAGLTAAVR